MGPTWVLSAPGGPHLGLMNFVIWEVIKNFSTWFHSNTKEICGFCRQTQSISLITMVSSSHPCVISHRGFYFYVHMMYMSELKYTCINNAALWLPNTCWFHRYKINEVNRLRYKNGDILTSGNWKTNTYCRVNATMFNFLESSYVFMHWWWRSVKRFALSLFVCLWVSLIGKSVKAVVLCEILPAPNWCLKVDCFTV